MSIKAELIDEIEVLLHFNLSTTQEGIKIHQDAKKELIDAAERLYDKGLIDQKDGGYITDLGYETAEHLQHVMRILTTG